MGSHVVTTNSKKWSFGCSREPVQTGFPRNLGTSYTLRYSWSHGGPRMSSGGFLVHFPNGLAARPYTTSEDVLLETTHSGRTSSIDHTNHHLRSLSHQSLFYDSIYVPNLRRISLQKIRPIKTNNVLNPLKQPLVGTSRHLYSV